MLLNNNKNKWTYCISTYLHVYYTYIYTDYSTPHKHILQLVSVHHQCTMHKLYLLCLIERRGDHGLRLLLLQFYAYEIDFSKSPTLTLSHRNSNNTQQ